MTTKISKLGPISFALFQGLLFSFLGLICGIFYSFGGLIYDFITTGSLNWGTALAFMALLGMPVLFGVAGVIAGWVQAHMYNFFARKWKPWHIDIEQ